MIVDKKLTCAKESTNKNYCTKVNDSDNKPKINANGKIDQPFYQGQLGDCVLMATLRGIGDNEQIGEDLQINMSLDEQGNYHINILNNEISVSHSEILKAKELGIYSNGDDDVLIIELAYEKYLRQTNASLKNATTKEVMEGNNISKNNLLRELTNNSKYKYFTRPDQHETTYTAEDVARIIELLESDKGRYCAWVGFKKPFVYPMNGNPIYFADKPDFVKTNITGAQGYMIRDQHAYEYRRVEILGDEKYVVLTNNQPFAQNREVKIPYEIFINSAKEIAISGENVAKFEEIYKESKSRQSSPEESAGDLSLMNIAKEKLDKELLRTVKGITTDLKNALKSAKGVEKVNLVNQYINYLKTVAPKELGMILCSNEIESLIKVIDKVGDRKTKKDLIMPIVNVSCELYASQVNSEESDEKQEYIEQIRTACLEALESKNHTDEGVIIDSVRKLACATCNE